MTKADQTLNTVIKLKAFKNIESAQKNRVWTLTITDQTQLQNFPSSGRMNYNKTLSDFSFYKEIENIFHQHRLPHVLTQAENTLGPYLPGQPATHFSRVDPGHAPASPSLRRSASETRVLDRSLEILLLADGRGLFFRAEGLLFLAEFRLDVFFFPLPFPFNPFLALFPPFLLLTAPWAGTGPLPLDSEKENIYLPFDSEQNSLFATHFCRSLMNHQRRPGDRRGSRTGGWSHPQRSETRGSGEGKKYIQ